MIAWLQKHAKNGQPFTALDSYMDNFMKQSAKSKEGQDACTIEPREDPIKHQSVASCFRTAVESQQASRN